MREENQTNNINHSFRFKELKTYGNTEWILDNKKKYRQVFDRSETTYIYIELSFFNKQFDKTNWDLDLSLRCQKILPTKKEICHLKLTKKISKYDAIAYIREGWGNKKKGSFWKDGKYQWELLINNKIIGTTTFYIIDSGATFDINNYLELDTFALLEGAYDDINSLNNKKYLTAFSQSHTRYIFCHLLFKNKLNRDWVGEFFIKFYNEQGDLKTTISRIIPVPNNNELAEVIAGFGSNTRGSWTKGKYKVEISFLNKLLASTRFTIGDEFEEGLVDVKLKYKSNKPLKKSKQNKETFESTMVKLDSLIGLNEIKQQVRDHAQYIKFLQLRNKKGLPEQSSVNVHSVFTGNPGTGKTTVARLLGEIYHQMGILSKGHVYEVDRVDLIGEFIGQTAPKVKDVIKKARGGVLFIDEAYALARSAEDNKDFGREAIEILIKEMSGPNKDMAVIVAGYPKEMQLFIDSNPGLKSRFKHFFHFKDYLPEELIQIADVACKNKGVQMVDKAKLVIDDIITEAYRGRNENFGNARFVYDLVEKAKMNLGLRIMSRKNPQKLSQNELSNIILSDVITLKQTKKTLLPNIPIDENLLASSLEELDQMIGINNIKTQVKELVDIVKYHKLSHKNVLTRFYLHTVFIGNPGTGKTTVARILTNIYKALGILERGHLVETDRQGLIAGFVGQTAIKTSEKIDEAMGGVLFIDEAYALSNFNGLQGDFGNEAIQTILKRMEDDRGKFFLFVAGYPDNMEVFLKANPGLSSRFDKKLIFHDYSVSELVMIGVDMAKSQKYHFDKKALKAFEIKIEDMVLTKDKYFGNARAVRQFINDIITTQNLRISNDKNLLSPQLMNKIKKIDVDMAIQKTSEKAIAKRKIGYK